MPDRVRDWFRIGHTTHADARTGCTVIVFDEQAPTVVDVRGGAPSTRETDLLASGRLVGRADAIVLTGGSAFGLAAADGVVRYLAELGRGFASAAGRVPIVPAAVVFDLGIGEPLHPTADDGYTAAASATRTGWETGRSGAGAGATVAKVGGKPAADGGVGIATCHTDDGTVTAIVVLNAVGDVRDPATGRWLARSVDERGNHLGARELAFERAARSRLGEHTTIGAILVSHAVSRDALTRCCVGAHDALARCVMPAHTMFDGDLFFASCPSTGESTPLQTLTLQCATEVAVERAIVSLFPPASD